MSNLSQQALPAGQNGDGADLQPRTVAESGPDQLHQALTHLSSTQYRGYCVPLRSKQHSQTIGHEAELERGDTVIPANSRRALCSEVIRKRSTSSTLAINQRFIDKHHLQRWFSTSRERQIMAYLAIHSRCSSIVPLYYAVDLTEIKACVVPRPIGWISTRNNQTGVDNLAPYVSYRAKLASKATWLMPWV